MKYCALLLFVIIGLFQTLWGNENNSQIANNKTTLYTNIDWVSSHIWRGGKSGNAPSLEPLIELGYGKFTIGSWAAATFDGAYKELDLYIIYSTDLFSFGLFDYYCPPSQLSESSYTNFHGENTDHLYSIDATFLGIPKFPLKLTASTLFLGADYNSESNAYNFSTYLEASYSKYWSNNSITVLAGLNTHQGIYAAKTALINTELTYKKSFDFNFFTLPVFGRVVYNPHNKNAWFIGGISISKTWS